MRRRSPINPESSISPISNSESPESLRKKYMKKIAPAFSIKNKYINNPDATDVILRKYYDDSKYELINDLEKVYPFKDNIYNMYAGYLGLNHNIYKLIPEIVKRINDGPNYYDPKNPYKTKSEKLLQFYHNLAKNTNKKVIPYLREIYINDSNSDYLNWPDLCKNPNAIEILTEEYEKDPNKLVWNSLCENENPKVIGIIQKEYENDSNSRKINWKKLSGNSKAIKIIEEEYKRVPNKLDWDALCGNPGAIKIIEEEYRKDSNSANINWNILSGNPKAINLLTIKINEEKILSNSPRSQTKKINWEKLSGNRKAIRLLKENTQKIWWNSLSGNTNPKAIKLLEERNSMFPKATQVDGKKKHIDWDILSGNPNAINLIIDRLKMEKQHEGHTHWHPDGLEGKRNINWPKLLANPSIFTVNRGSLQFTEQEKIYKRQLLKIETEQKEQSERENQAWLRRQKEQLERANKAMGAKTI